jgi:hypothetical protein
MTDEELDAWLARARGQIDADIARERRDVVPDFAAVIEAAHAASPAIVSEAALREVAEFAPIVELDAGLDYDDEHTDALAAMIADARELTEDSVARRRLAGIPPLRATLAPAPAARGPFVWIMLVALAAIIVGLAIGLPRLLELVGGQHAATQIDNQAEFIHEPKPAEGEVDPRHLVVPPQPHAAIVHEAGETATAQADPTEPREQPRARKRELGVALRDRVAELEQRARAHWQAGELGQAEAIYREIVSIAGRTRYADLAYGDLFTLAHQRKDTAAELALWHEYLGVFPRGRFAEDARAGLCRKSEPDRRSACWRAYLDDFPDGLHAGRARRELGDVP